MRGELRVGLAVLSAICALAATGCGDSDETDGAAAEVRATYARLSDDLAGGRLAAACAALTARAARYVGALAHGVPRSCEQDLRRFFELMGTREGSLAPPRVVAVRIDGVRATVVARDRRGQTVRLPFVQDGGGWKASNILGVTAPPTPDVR